MARMTAEQPEDRPQSIEDVIRAIDEIRNIRQKTKAQKPEITEARRWPDRTGANQPDAPQRRDSARSVDVPDRHSTQEVATTTPPAKTQLKPGHKWMAITGIFVLLLITGVLATNNGVFQATDEASQGDSAGTSPPDSASSVLPRQLIPRRRAVVEFCSSCQPAISIGGYRPADSVTPRQRV